MQVRKPTRFAHTAGYSNVCFSEDGRYIVTCGSEGDVRIWKGLDDDNPTEKCVGEKASAVIQKENKLFVASDFTVQILSFPEAEIQSILTRFKDLVTTLDVSADGTLVAAGSADSTIQLVETHSSNIKYFEGHTGSILCVAIDPRKEYLAASSCDGTVRIWRISDQQLVKTWNDVTDLSDSYEKRTSLCGVCFEPGNGRRLSIACKSTIRFYQRSTWNEISSLKMSPGFIKDYSVMTWSKCGRYLATSAHNGEIIVWDIMLNTMVSSSFSKEKHLVSGLSWNPDSSKAQLAFVDFDGQFGLVDKCYQQLTMGRKQVEEMTETHEDDENEEEDVKSEQDDEADGNISPGNCDNTEDEDNPDAISIERIKAECSMNYENSSASEENSDDDDVKFGSLLYDQPFECDPPFQPTSMPTSFERRFMVFNDIGYVKQTNTEDENTIEVDFHNRSVYHAFRINNILGHHIAALGSQQLVTACERMDDNRSKVVCVRFDGWTDRQWDVNLPPNENAALVAVGNNFVAVVTDLPILRIFTESGFLKEILTIEGKPLTMNARHNLLVIVYHAAARPVEKQNLLFNAYQIGKSVKVILSGERLALTRDADLRWIGFSDNLNVCSADSNGVVQIYTNETWRPISLIDEDLESKMDHYFVIGVDERTTTIRCILCKGSFYPLLIPHPFIIEKKWSLPVCDQQVECGTFEQILLTEKLVSQCLPSTGDTGKRDCIHAGLKLFALCCRADLDRKAMDVLSFVDDVKLAETAHKYCAQRSKLNLADKISDWISEKTNIHREDIQTDDVFDTDEYNEAKDNFQTQSSSVTISTIDGQEEENWLGRQGPSDSASLTSNGPIRRSLNERDKKLTKRRFNPFKIPSTASRMENNEKMVFNTTDDDSIDEVSSAKAVDGDVQSLKRKCNISELTGETDSKKDKKATVSKLKAFVFHKNDK